IRTFEDFELDLGAFELRHRGQSVVVQPKVLEVLIYLVEDRDRVVTKQELLEGVWKGIVVGDAALARAISEARKALGDDSDGPRAIKTVHGRGYRFIGTLASPETLEKEDAAGVPTIAPLPPAETEGPTLSVSAAISDDFVGRTAALELFDELADAT